VLLDPLPYEEPDRLTMIWAQLDALGVEQASLSGPEISDLWQESRLYEDVGGIWPRFATLGDVDDPEQVHIGWVTGNFFEVLGARPQLGCNLVLFLLGGATGLLVAAAALVLLEIVRPPEPPRLDAVDLDLTMLGFNLLATLACGLVFCTVSAWQSTR
jgi:hypothetical protein